MKTQVNAILRDAGLGFVKVSTGGYGPADVCYTEGNSRVKGIYAASHGPMTVTNVYRNATDGLMNTIVNDIMNLGIKRDENGVFIVKETSKSVTKLVLSERWLPAYTRSANLDEGYKNIYIVPTYIVEAK